MSVRRASLFNGPSMDTVDTVVTLTAADANSSSKILSSPALSKRPTVLVASPSEVARPLNGGHSSLVVVNGRAPPPLPRPRSPLRPASIFLPAARQGRRAGMLVGKQTSFLPHCGSVEGAARRNRQVAAVAARRRVSMVTAPAYHNQYVQARARTYTRTRLSLH